MRYPRLNRFDGFLRRTRQRARRQNRHVGSRYTTGDQFPAQIVQELTQRIGDGGDKGKAIRQILPAWIAEHYVILTRFGCLLHGAELDTIELTPTTSVPCKNSFTSAARGFIT